MTVEVVLVVFSVISVRPFVRQGPLPALDRHPVSDKTILLPPVPAVFAVKVNGFAAAAEVTVGFAADTFLKQVPELQADEESSRAARILVAVAKWPDVPDPPSSTALVGVLPLGKEDTIE